MKINGIINFFKPRGMSSHDAVNFLRNKLNIKRIGHTGTLDPEVTGVLPLCIGRATRVSEYLLDADKEYIAELTLGVKTESQDSEGRALKSSDKKITEKQIRSVFDKYLGEIEQIPPMYSALKHKGEKLYDLARDGIVVEREPRLVQIHELEILNIETNNKILFRVKCSKGTYIRTLCEDIASELGTLGYMSYLIRTGVYKFDISNAIGKDTIDNISLDELKKFVIPMDWGIDNLPKIVLDDNKYKPLSHGTKVILKNGYDYDAGKEYRIYSKNIFIGIGSIDKKDNKHYIRMRKVLLT